MYNFTFNLESLSRVQALCRAAQKQPFDVRVGYCSRGMVDAKSIMSLLCVAMQRDCVVEVPNEKAYHMLQDSLLQECYT